MNTSPLWKPPKIHDRYDLPRGIVFVVTCEPGFSRKLGSLVELDGTVWEVLGWDDHKTSCSPFDGESIALRVGNPTSLDLWQAFVDAEAAGEEAYAAFLHGLRSPDGHCKTFPGCSARDLHGSACELDRGHGGSHRSAAGIF